MVNNGWWVDGWWMVGGWVLVGDWLDNGLLVMVNDTTPTVHGYELSKYSLFCDCYTVGLHVHDATSGTTFGPQWTITLGIFKHPCLIHVDHLISLVLLILVTGCHWCHQKFFTANNRVYLKIQVILTGQCQCNYSAVGLLITRITRSPCNSQPQSFHGS